MMGYYDSMLAGMGLGGAQGAQSWQPLTQGGGAQGAQSWQPLTQGGSAGSGYGPRQPLMPGMNMNGGGAGQYSAQQPLMPGTNMGHPYPTSMGGMGGLPAPTGWGGMGASMGGGPPVPNQWAGGVSLRQMTSPFSNFGGFRNRGGMMGYR